MSLFFLSRNSLSCICAMRSYAVQNWEGRVLSGTWKKVRLLNSVQDIFEDGFFPRRKAISENFEYLIIRLPSCRGVRPYNAWRIVRWCSRFIHGE